MVNALRQLAVRTLTLPGVVPLVQRWNHDLGIVFMLHRIACPERGIRGQDPEVLRSALELLRRHRFSIVPVSELLEWARAPERALGPRVAFTLDDGYVEQADTAAPIFAEFDAPATIFPVTGFVDGEFWLWWDRLRFLVESTERPSMPCPELRPLPEEVPLDTAAARHRVRRAIGFGMKRMSITERNVRLDEVAVTLEVELPDAPPPAYAPMTWDDARRCGALGMRFGPHTVRHPTLSRESDDDVRREISGSWERVRAEVDAPEPIFCYPNGRRGDFGGREVRLAAEAGLDGAVTAEPGYVTAASPRSAPGTAAGVAPFEVPRFSFPDLHSSLVRIISGLSVEQRVELPVRKRALTRVPSAAGGASPERAPARGRARAAAAGD